MVRKKICSTVEDICKLICEMEAGGAVNTIPSRQITFQGQLLVPSVHVFNTHNI